MGTVETFDHTADVGLRITGADLDDLFRTAAEGLFDYVVTDRKAVRLEDRESVELTAVETTELLVVWLNELIYRSETRHRLYGGFRVTVASDGLALRAEIEGESIDPDRHELDHEVKAATRHGVGLERTAEGWVAELVLDI